MQLDVDIGSSSVARGVVNLVVGYLSKLVIELAFLIQVSCHGSCVEVLFRPSNLVDHNTHILNSSIQG